MGARRALYIYKEYVPTVADTYNYSPTKTLVLCGWITDACERTSWGTFVSFTFVVFAPFCRRRCIRKTQIYAEGCETGCGNIAVRIKQNGPWNSSRWPLWTAVESWLDAVWLVVSLLLSPTVRDELWYLGVTMECGSFCLAWSNESVRIDNAIGGWVGFWILRWAACFQTYMVMPGIWTGACWWQMWSFPQCECDLRDWKVAGLRPLCFASVHYATIRP
jgi:hypothetical protein